MKIVVSPQPSIHVGAGEGARAVINDAELFFPYNQEVDVTTDQYHALLDSHLIVSVVPEPPIAFMPEEKTHTTSKQRNT